jgi:hypothetical protein
MLNAKKATMNEFTPEIEARYKVVTLLYVGKIQEAEVALDAFVNDGTISQKHEAFYRFLVAGARRYAADLDASFDDIPTASQPESQPSQTSAYQL